MQPDRVHVALEVGAVGEHPLDELDLVGAAVVAERQPADHHAGLRVHRLDRRPRGHVEIRVGLGRVRLRAQEGGGVLLVPDLVRRDRELRQVGVRLPEAAAAAVALREDVGVGGEVAVVRRRDHRIAVARDHAGPRGRVVHDRVPAHVVLRHHRDERVVQRPVVIVVAAGGRPRLHVLPARVLACQRDAGARDRRELRRPRRARAAVEQVLHVDAVEGVGHGRAGGLRPA